MPPLHALAWVLLYTIAVVGAWFNPLYGLFGYLLEYFQRPAIYPWWGKSLPDLRWNFTIAAVATAAYLIKRDSLPATRRATNVALTLLLLQALNTTIVSLWAVNPEMSWKWSVQYWKLGVCFLLFSGVVRTPETLKWAILFQIVGAGYWGWDALDKQRVAARLEGMGSGDTKNANMLAGHLLTIIPLACMFALQKREWWIRATALGSLVLIINLFILANSRGATVGLVAVVLAAFVLVRHGYRKRILLGAAAGVAAVFLLADADYIERQQTIVTAEDGAAQTRFALWRGSAAMIRDYPFGVGGRGFHVLSPQYVPELEESDDGEGRSAHNTYIQVAADWGVQGLALFLALIAYTFVLLHRVRRERATADQVYFFSLGLQLGLIGTLTAAYFSVRFYGESIYWLCALSTALYRMTGPAVAAHEEPQRRVERAAA